MRRCNHKCKFIVEAIQSAGQYTYILYVPIGNCIHYNDCRQHTRLGLLLALALHATFYTAN